MERKTGYKYTDAWDCTRGGMQWAQGVEHEAPGDGALCTSGWLHLYDSPEVAALRDPADGCYTRQSSAQLWRVEWWGATKDERGLKRGAQFVRTVERVEPVVLTDAQRVRAAIYCVQSILSRDTCASWWTWAEGWLMGKRGRADAATAYAAYAAYAAAATDAAAYAAATTAAAATSAADAAADAAYAAAAAADDADAAALAAVAAAAATAADAAAPPDLAAIVRRAIADEPTGKGGA